MGNQVLDWPLQLLDKVYKGLNSREATRRGYMVKELPSYANNVQGDKIAISFNFSSAVTKWGYMLGG